MQKHTFYSPFSGLRASAPAWSSSLPFAVPEENIYIRLEDVIFIGEEKAEIVTSFLPMDIAGIESIMKEEGMLQRYPRMVEK